MLVGLMVIAAEGSAWADCAGCQACDLDNFHQPPRDRCAPANDEDGYMCCETIPLGDGSWCQFGGEPCYGVVIEDPPGGGGGGGGGGSCSVTTGWCPAECFSCRRTY